MPARLLGAHMPTAGGIDKALRRGREIGCTAVQVFTSSPQQWKFRELTSDIIEKFSAARAETGIDALVSHDSYLVNLAAPDPELQCKSIDALKSELSRCSALGIPNVVSHMGAHMGQGVECGLERVAKGALEVLADSPHNVTLLMETTAGQGTCLNAQFEQLAKVLELTKAHERLAVCLDTCHVFAAGYDIRTQEAYWETFERFERLIGLDRLRVIHCNDSKKPLGSRVDRHEHLGEGEIGEHAFQMLVNDPRFEHTPIIIETPEADSAHAANLAKLWKWASEPNCVV